MLESLSLDGKTIVVTGGGTGLGREMVLAMARAGADVVVASRRTGPIEEVASLVKDLGRRSIAISTDVTDSAQVDRLFQATLDEFGQVDVLFNNAGIFPKGDGSPVETSEEVWQRVIDVLLKGVFLGCKHGNPALLASGGGSTVNTASFVAVVGAATHPSA